jgi:hypothetical protein
VTLEDAYPVIVTDKFVQPIEPQPGFWEPYTR